MSSAENFTQNTSILAFHPMILTISGNMSRQSSTSSDDDEGVTINFPHHNLGYQGKDCQTLPLIGQTQQATN